MDNPQNYYSSTGMPVGTRQVYFWRLNAPPLPPAFPLATPGGNTGAGPSAASTAYATGATTALGIYNLEMLGWKENGKEIDRNTPLGADQDFALLRGKITGSATAQLATGTTTKLLRVGDIFELSIGIQKDGATALPLCRFVVIDVSKDENEGTPNKQSLTLRLDRDNSDQFWQS